jgi:hypothetical protein
VSTFIPLVILILLSSGWFTFLPYQLDITKQKIIIYLAIISCTSLLPPISITTFMDIHLDYLCLFILFLFLLKRIPLDRLATLISLMIMLGSFLFLFHEVSRTALWWKSFTFQWFTIFLSMGEAIISTSLIMEQFCLVFGGLLITQCGLYYLYHDRLSPMVIPGLGASDTFWITVSILIIVKKLQLWVPTIQKNWRLAYWTKKR